MRRPHWILLALATLGLVLGLLYRQAARHEAFLERYENDQQNARHRAAWERYNAQSPASERVQAE